MSALSSRKGFRKQSGDCTRRRIEANFPLEFGVLVEWDFFPIDEMPGTLLSSGNRGVSESDVSSSNCSEELSSSSQVGSVWIVSDKKNQY